MQDNIHVPPSSIDTLCQHRRRVRHRGRARGSPNEWDAATVATTTTEIVSVIDAFVEAFVFHNEEDNGEYENLQDG